MTKKEKAEFDRVVRKANRVLSGEVVVTPCLDGSRRYPVHVIQENGLEFDYVVDLNWRKGWATFVTVEAQAKIGDKK